MLKMLTTYMPAWLSYNIVNGGRGNSRHKVLISSLVQIYFVQDQWTKYFEQTSILKKSLFSSLPLSNNAENVDNIHAGLAQLQHC